MNSKKTQTPQKTLNSPTKKPLVSGKTAFYLSFLSLLIWLGYLGFTSWVTLDIGWAALFIAPILGVFALLFDPANRKSAIWAIILPIGNFLLLGLYSFVISQALIS